MRQNLERSSRHALNAVFPSTLLRPAPPPSISNASNHRTPSTCEASASHHIGSLSLSPRHGSRMNARWLCRHSHGHIAQLLAP
eukprot:3249240-Alexandrium_andersonii.AAC.1